MIRQFGSVQLIGTRDGPRIVTIKENIQKVKNRLPRKTEGISSKTFEGARYFCNKCQTNIKNRFRAQIL